jgi:hypothetical protein
MNYIKKCLISALEANIYNENLHDLGLIIGRLMKKFIRDEKGYKESCFLKGITEGLQEVN